MEPLLVIKTYLYCIKLYYHGLFELLRINHRIRYNSPLIVIISFNHWYEGLITTIST